MGRKIWIKNSNPKYQNNNYNYNKGYNNNYNNNNFNNNNNFTKKVHVNQSKTIFVGNLNWSTDSETLSKVFEPCGKVADVRIGRKPDGRSRGFAYVEFETEEAAEKALAMKGTMVNEREINIDQFNKVNDNNNMNMNNMNRGNFRGGNRGNFRGGNRGRGGYY